MNVYARLVLLATIGFAVCVHAAPLQIVTLADGTVMRAEVVALSDGIYTFRSKSLGELKIPAVNVQSISAAGQTAAAPGAASGQIDIDAMRQSLIEDPESMQKIQSLRDDPLIQDILADEETMRAINTGDINALMNNPKVKALLEHSTIQELSQGSGY